MAGRRIAHGRFHHLPSSLYEPPVGELAPDVCAFCCGVGSVLETWDVERYDEWAKCPLCGGTGKKKPPGRAAGSEGH
jgi:hypothetical protein